METRLGRAFRAVRLRLDWRQADVAAKAGVHRSTISLIERGHWRHLSHDVLMRVAEVLEIRLTIEANWRGGELERLINADHSQLHELVAGLLEEHVPWLRLPEVSFAIAGERGIIDILCVFTRRPGRCSWSSSRRSSPLPIALPLG